MDKEVKKLIKELKKQDFDVDEKGKHPKVYSPDGRWIVTLPSSSSDWRGLKNATSELKKHGYKRKS